MTVMLIIVNITYVQAMTVPTQNEITRYLDSIARYELTTIKNPSYGSVGGEWTIMGLARYGTITDNYISLYKSNLAKKLKACDGILSTQKYTEYARVVIALTSIEENPGNYGGYNLLKPLAEFDKVTAQGANGVVYTLIALDCGDYDIPKPGNDYKGKITTRDELVNIILNKQLEDGGWSFMGTKSDTDMTAMVIQALAPYYYKDEKVKKAVDRGLDRLGELQQKDGGYKTGKLENCESTAQVLTALSVMNIGIEDHRFVKDGKTIIDGMMKYYRNGGFSHLPDGDVNQMATDQAMYAMTAYYRSISGMNGLYKMKDGMTRRELKEEKTSENATKENTEEQGSNKKKTLKSKKSTKTVSKKTVKSSKVNNDTNNSTNNPTMVNGETMTAEIETAKKDKKPKKKKSDETTISKTDIQSESEISTTEKSSATNQDSKKSSTTGILCIVIIIGGSSGAAGYNIYKKRKIKNKGKK